jgi:hypothetical protein
LRPAGTQEKSWKNSTLGYKTYDDHPHHYLFHIIQQRPVTDYFDVEDIFNNNNNNMTS